MEGVPDMMNDFSSISYEIEHILEEVRQPPYHIGYKYIKQYYLKITIKERELEREAVNEVERSKSSRNEEEASEAVSLLHFMVAQSTSLFRSILATLSQIVS